jgi:hypothetical protein
MRLRGIEMSETPKTLSASKDEPQLLSQDGGIQLRDFNPKAILRFAGRRCITCNGEIMDHWLRYQDDPDLRAEYWCSRTGNQFSQGITDCQYDVPEGFGSTNK